jgi:two-component system, LytTR family, sensor histidine kinase AgrC
MEIFIIFLGSFLETLSILLIGFSLIGLRIKANLFTILSLGIYGGVFLVIVKEQVPSYIFLGIGLLTLSIILTLFTKVPMGPSIIAILAGSLGLMLGEALTLSFLQLFVDVTSALETKVFRLAVATPHLLLTFIIALLINRYKFTIIDVSIQQSGKGSSTIYQSVLAILLSTLFLFYYISEKRSDHVNLTLIDPFVLLSITLFIFVFMNKMVKQAVSTSEIKFYSGYEKEIMNMFRIVKSQRHDFIHHLSAIDGMIQNNRFEECRKYLKNMLAEVEEINEVLPINSPSLAGLLLSYKQQASTRNIQLTINIKDHLKYIPTNAMETNQIIGNLLKNAIEAVSDLEARKRYIDLIIEKDHEDYMIEITNPAILKEEDLYKMFEYGFSTKPNNEGSGLSTVTKIVQLYKGTIYPEIRDQLITLIVTIPRERH